MIRNLEEEGNEYYVIGDLNWNLLQAEKRVHDKQVDIKDIYQLEKW